jgi:hypothetical protein
MDDHLSDDPRMKRWNADIDSKSMSPESQAITRALIAALADEAYQNSRRYRLLGKRLGHAWLRRQMRRGRPASRR